MTREELSLRRNQLIEQNFEAIESGEITVPQLAKMLNSSIQVARTLRNKFIQLRYIEEFQMWKQSKEPVFLNDFKNREPDYVREFELEQRVQVDPIRTQQVDGKIIVTYASRLNHE